MTTSRRPPGKVLLHNRTAAELDGALMAENSTISAKRRGPGRPFRPGQSGNPGGRPLGLAERARRATRDGATTVRFMASVLAGKVDGASVRDRIMAATWLCDRGYGKPCPEVGPWVITPDQVNLFVECVVQAVRAQVKDPATLKAIVDEFDRASNRVKLTVSNHRQYERQAQGQPP